MLWAKKKDEGSMAREETASWAGQAGLLATEAKWLLRPLSIERLSFKKKKKTAIGIFAVP